MSELTFSVMQTEDVDAKGVLGPLLEAFTARTGIRVTLRLLSWTTGMEELLRTVLYGEGPHVSEIGTSWVSSFLSMNGLQPFTERDLRMIGREEEFLPAAWASGAPPDRRRFWSIPWLAGTRLLYYRKDLLDQAGIDPETAFKDHPALFATLEGLQASGVAAPWVVPTRMSLNTIHYISSWVWGAGGDYLSSDGALVLLNTEETYSGLMDYYSLQRFLPQPAGSLDDETVDRIFWQDGQAAVTIGGHWLMRAFRDQCPPAIYENLGVVPVPGVPFVGGSNLVIWEHTRNRQDALSLIQFLSSDAVQQTYAQAVGLLPVRKALLAQPPFSTDPVYQAAGREIDQGRGFSSIAMWNVFERRLTDAFAHIWSSMLTDPQAERMDMISHQLDPLARRLDIMLRSRN